MVSVGVLPWEEDDAHGFLALLPGLIWGYFHMFAESFYTFSLSSLVFVGLQLQVMPVTYDAFYIR